MSRSMIKKTLPPVVGLVLLAIVVFAAAVLAVDPPPPIDGQFQAFGSARLVNGGLPPDNTAVDLGLAQCLMRACASWQFPPHRSSQEPIHFPFKY